MPTGAQIIDAVEHYTGQWYSQVNPQGTSGYDCSGVVQAGMRDLGVAISRTTVSQLADANRQGGVGVNIGTSLSSAQPGDILHYSGHEEVWVGNGMVFSESDYKTQAAVRKRTPWPIVAIVRYSDGSASTVQAGGASAGAPSNPDQGAAGGGGFFDAMRSIGPILSGLTAVAVFLTTPANWWRVGLFLLGALATFVGAIRLVRSS